MKFNFISKSSEETSQLEKKIKDFKKKMEKFEKVVLLTHAPPYNTRLDKIIEESCGNKSIRKFIKKHKKIVLAVSGHLHENAGREDHVGSTRVVNPGPFGRVMSI